MSAPARAAPPARDSPASAHNTASAATSRVVRAEARKAKKSAPSSLNSSLGGLAHGVSGSSIFIFASLPASHCARLCSFHATLRHALRRGRSQWAPLQVRCATPRTAWRGYLRRAGRSASSRTVGTGRAQVRRQSVGAHTGLTRVAVTASRGAKAVLVITATERAGCAGGAARPPSSRRPSVVGGRTPRMKSAHAGGTCVVARTRNASSLASSCFVRQSEPRRASWPRARLRLCCVKAFAVWALSRCARHAPSRHARLARASRAA